VIPTPPWPQLLEELDAGKVPVMIITGTDRIGITEAHRDIARRHHAQIVVIQNASHFVRRDAPSAFMAVAGGFLHDVLPVTA
jgi:pimeloyl-ACP methyl ester carboxylesterase